MIKAFHHIALIVSSNASIMFYEKMGFQEVSRTNRGYDVLVYLEGYGILLEIYVDAKHPPRADRPEALGLRHLAFEVDNLEEMLKEWNIEVVPIRECNGEKYTFVRDPDGLPSELREKKRTSETL